MSVRGEFIREFVIETKESLDLLDSDLVALEADAGDGRRLDSIFRILHTIKGSAGFLQFDKLQSLAHSGENLLTELRSGDRTLTPETTNTLLDLVDAIRQIVDKIEATGSEPETEVQGVTATPVENVAAAGTRESAEQQSSSVPAPAKLPAPNSSTSVIAPDEPVAANPSGKAKPKGRRDADDPLRTIDWQRPKDGKRAPVAAAPPASASAAAVEPAPRSNIGSTLPGGIQSESIRVDVNLLDRLMNLVGELVLTRNQIVQFTDDRRNAQLHKHSQQLNLITTELQAGIMKTRLQQIGSVWQKFPRMVRDLARQCGKEVVLHTEGGETELDKSLLEAISDPLVHLVRNAIDHGIEKPDIRRAKGKPEKGRLALKAYHEGGQVNIEIADDGAGLDVDKIREQALQRGLFDPDDATAFSEEKVSSSIFLPGFSTVEQATNLSGRGVGMDVVKTKIEDIGGMVDVYSRKGEGTTIRIKVPLTLAIIPALIVQSGGDRYAIPQVNLDELVAFPAEAAQRRIERVHNSVVYRLRGKLLPLVFLNQLLRIDATDSPQSETIHIVVVRVGQQRFGLVVDKIVTSEEIVVKPLGDTLKNIPVYAGATILGDGTAVLILDTLGLARFAGVFTEEHRRTYREDSRAPLSTVSPDGLLLCRVGADRRVGIPISQLMRIERMPAGRVEKSFDRDVVQYRDGLLYLLPVHRLFAAAEDPMPRDLINVVICDGEEPFLGLIVDQVLDIVEMPEDISRSNTSDCCSGTVVVGGRVTDILDVAELQKSSLERI